MINAKYHLLSQLFLILLLSQCTVKPVPQVVSPSNETTQTVTSQPNTMESVESVKDRLCTTSPLPASFVTELEQRTSVPNCLDVDAEIQLRISDLDPISHWIYVLAAPFFTIDDDMNSELLKNAWLYGSQSGVMITHLMVDQNTFDLFSIVWGSPDPQFVIIQSQDDLKEQAMQNPTHWAILPFERIEPEWKIITIDEQSPIRKDFSLEDYSLQIPISLIPRFQENEPNLQSLLEEWQIPTTNRDPEKLTTVLVTGVTAMVRGTANTMEQWGMTYPADDIRPWFLEADIVHISNEIAFSKKCPQPFPRQDDLVFCSQTEYIELLESINTTVVELSGDHFQDYGPEATLYTLELYDERGWQYYGGGVNLEEGQKPIKLEDHGNKIAFIGCNAKGGGYAGASATNPGAARCDFDYMTDQITQLRAEGYLPIVTFQHLEYYSYKAHPILQEDFRLVADAGAVIVSGSQAHQPHAIELRDGALLHYGLGNLFFDQLFESPETGQAIIDRHVMYDGRYINTELLTIQFINLARSRPMTLEERQLLLHKVFQVSIQPD
jgi:poly-gamma-glutamate synthesis protein (capsule biosynthesis protein)